MEWFDRVLAKRDDVIPSFINVDAINSYVDNSIQLDQPEMTGAETAADIALGFAPGIGTAMGFRDFERARRDDDKLGMGLGILSMIPVAGGAVRAAGKGLKAVDEIDPRFAYSPERKGDLERVASTTRQVERPNKVDTPEVSIFDYEGYPFVTSMSDRTDAGGILTAINDLALKRPVELQGGQDYMFNNPGRVWASDKGPVTGILREGVSAEKRSPGKNALFLPFRMAPTGGDYSHMTSEALLSYADSALGRSDKKLLNAQMKNLIPNWKGINSPQAAVQLRESGGDTRKAVIQMLDRDFRDAGGITGGEARVAVADPRQLAAKQGHLQNVGMIDTSVGRITPSGHGTYSDAVAGEGVGRLIEDVPAYALLPAKAAARGVADVGNPSAPDMRSLQMSARSGVLTEGILKNLEEYLKSLKAD